MSIGLRLAALPLIVLAACSTSNHIIDAARTGDNQRLESMLSQGKTSVDHPGPEGSTALYWAAAEGHTSTVELLLNRGANPSSRTARNSTSLEVAALGGHTRIVRLLLDAGAEMNVQSDDYGSTPLMLAVTEGHTDIAKLLVERGADLGLKNHTGQTALNSAAREGRTTIVEILIAAGADVNTSTPSGFSALYLAAMNGHFEAARILLVAGADPDVPTGKGMTSLWAALEGHRDIARLLIENGANVDAKESERGDTPLIDSARRDDLKSAKLLLNAGANPDLRNRDDISAMAVAAIKGRSDLVTLLVRYEADVNLAVSGGLTPLHFAVGHRQRFPDFKGSKEVARILIASGANVHAETLAGETPMQLATKLGNLEFVELLRANGATH